MTINFRQLVESVYILNENMEQHTDHITQSLHKNGFKLSKTFTQGDSTIHNYKHEDGSSIRVESELGRDKKPISSVTLHTKNGASSFGHHDLSSGNVMDHMHQKVNTLRSMESHQNNIEHVKRSTDPSSIHHAVLKTNNVDISNAAIHNPHTSSETLNHMHTRPNSSTSPHLLASHPNADSHLLHRIATTPIPHQHDTGHDILAKVAKHPNTSSNTLRHIYDNHPHLRTEVSNHPNGSSLRNFGLPH